MIAFLLPGLEPCCGFIAGQQNEQCAGFPVAPETETHIDAEEIRHELDRILSSRIFATARRSRMFLHYVVERSLVNSAPKEFEVAVEVLGRGADYDPEVDATVRVEASRLRHRLREYYDTAGRTYLILIDIPKGGYGAVFASREGNAHSSASNAASSSQEQSNALRDRDLTVPKYTARRQLSPTSSKRHPRPDGLSTSPGGSELRSQWPRLPPSW